MTYFCVQTARKFKMIDKYVNNWLIREALKARLKYTTDWERKKEARKIAAELNTAGRGLFCGVQNHSRMYCKTIKIYA